MPNNNEQLDITTNQLSKLTERVDYLEIAVGNHAGIDVGYQDIYSPHPNMIVSSITIGDEDLRGSAGFLQIKADSLCCDSTVIAFVEDLIPPSDDICINDGGELNVIIAGRNSSIDCPAQATGSLSLTVADPCQCCGLKRSGVTIAHSASPCFVTSNIYSDSYSADNCKLTHTRINMLSNHNVCGGWGMACITQWAKETVCCVSYRSGLNLISTDLGGCPVTSTTLSSGKCGCTLSSIGTTYPNHNVVVNSSTFLTEGEMTYTLSGGVLTGQGNIRTNSLQIAAQTGTTDDFTALPNFDSYDGLFFIRPDSGDAITVKHNVTPGCICTHSKFFNISQQDVTLDSCDAPLDWALYWYSDTQKLYLELINAQMLTNIGGGGALTYNTVDEAFIVDNNNEEGLTLKDQFTLTNPGTTLTEVFNITGKGTLFGVYWDKPGTANSVSVHAELTIDGNVVVNDVSQHAATSGNRIGLMGNTAFAEDAGSGSPWGLGGASIPFNTGIRLRLRFSGNPGSSENITGGFSLAYE